MPTRLIREGILTSDRVDQLDPPAEVFYRRLLSKVDDHGLYDARPSILRANLYPLRLDRVREADIPRWMAACQKAGLIALYENGGKPYLMAFNTGWEKRSAPKYPLPPENIRKQAETMSNTSTVVVVGVVDEVKPLAPSANALEAEAPPKSPLNGAEAIPLNDGSEWHCPDDFYAELDRLYPRVDPVQTMREIRGWCVANPSKRKTKRGVMKFVAGWFQREQDKHG